MVCTEPFLYRTASIVGVAVGFLHNTNKKSCNTLCVRLATSAPCSNRPMITELLYFHDPMCSWCRAFSVVDSRVQAVANRVDGAACGWRAGPGHQRAHAI